MYAIEKIECAECAFEVNAYTTNIIPHNRTDINQNMKTYKHISKMTNNNF